MTDACVSRAYGLGGLLEMRRPGHAASTRVLAQNLTAALGAKCLLVKLKTQITFSGHPAERACLKGLFF